MYTDSGTQMVDDSRRYGLAPTEVGESEKGGSIAQMTGCSHLADGRLLPSDCPKPGTTGVFTVAPPNGCVRC
jgi:hypothetical protein